MTTSRCTARWAAPILLAALDLRFPASYRAGRAAWARRQLPNGRRWCARHPIRWSRFESPARLAGADPLARRAWRPRQPRWSPKGARNRSPTISSSRRFTRIAAMVAGWLPQAKSPSSRASSIMTTWGRIFRLVTEMITQPKVRARRILNGSATRAKSTTSPKRWRGNNDEELGKWTLQARAPIQEPPAAAIRTEALSRD